MYKELLATVPKDAKVEYENEELVYTITYKYIPDFVVTLKNGRKIYIETKGMGRQFDASVRRKMVEVIKQHPDKDIRVIFYRNGEYGRKRRNGTKMSQAEWATKSKIDFTIREVKTEWFE